MPYMCHMTCFAQVLHVLHDLLCTCLTWPALSMSYMFSMTYSVHVVYFLHDLLYAWLMCSAWLALCMSYMFCMTCYMHVLHVLHDLLCTCPAWPACGTCLVALVRAWLICLACPTPYMTHMFHMTCSMCTPYMTCSVHALICSATPAVCMLYIFSMTCSVHALHALPAARRGSVPELMQLCSQSAQPQSDTSSPRRRAAGTSQSQTTCCKYNMKAMTSKV